MLFSDKLVSTQRDHIRMYRGDDGDERLYQTICRSSGIEDPRDHFDLVETDMFTQEEMGSNPVTQRFYQMLIRMIGARNGLEIGTFIGVSTMIMLEAMGPEGRFHTVEKFDKFADIARNNFERNGFAGQISQIVGDAFEHIADIEKEGPFDFVFIDGNKERYADYFRMLWPSVAPGGIAIVDDCFFHGDALNEEPESEKGVGVRELLDHAVSLGDCLRLAIPLSNGVFVFLKEAQG